MMVHVGVWEDWVGQVHVKLAFPGIRVMNIGFARSAVSAANCSIDPKCCYKIVTNFFFYFLALDRYQSSLGGYRTVVADWPLADNCSVTGVFESKCWVLYMQNKHVYSVIF